MYRTGSLIFALALLLGLAACETPAPPPTTAADGGQTAGVEAGGAGGTQPPAPASKLHVERTETFYDVTGTSARTLLRDLQQRGPRIGSERHFGRTAWTARWEIQYTGPADGETSDRACRMRRADVFMDVDVTLPRWDAPDEAPTALRRDWTSFADALAFHEREHQESIISAGRRVVRALEDLSAPTCAQLKQRANAEARALIEEARAYNRHYDERTGHGRTQGARWPQP